MREGGLRGGILDVRCVDESIKQYYEHMYKTKSDFTHMCDVDCEHMFNSMLI